LFESQIKKRSPGNSYALDPLQWDPSETCVLITIAIKKIEAKVHKQVEHQELGPAQHRLQRTPKELGQAAAPPLGNRRVLPEAAR
jgi:hypothetical protein